jgi:hypothetical protein
MGCTLKSGGEGSVHAAGSLQAACRKSGSYFNNLRAFCGEDCAVAGDEVCGNEQSAEHQLGAPPSRLQFFVIVRPVTVPSVLCAKRMP